MKLAYTGYTNSGDAAKGEIEAGSIEEAREQLRKRGVFVTDIKADSGRRTHDQHRVKPAMFDGKRLKSLAVFTRQLSVLVGSGTPLVQALVTVEHQMTDEEWEQVTRDLRSRVEEGASLGDAMAHHPRFFDPVARSLVAAGESSGKLDAMLSRLATLTRDQQKISSALLGAMLYPAVLLFICIVVLVVMLVVVLPRFAGMFETLDAELPITTEIMLVLSNSLRGYWWAWIAGIGGSVGTMLWWVGTGQGRENLDRLLVHAPIVGPIARSLIVARILRLLGLLTNGKVPLLNAIELAEDATTNAAYADLLDRCHRGVERGESLAAMLNNPTLIPRSISESIRNGEQTGRLSNVLSAMADMLDEENDQSVRTLSSVLEPVILIFLGLVVAMVSLSMFLPLFDLTSATGGPA